MAGISEKPLGQPGVLRTLSGGTRNKINLNRPWQMDLPYAPEKCPFCKKEEPEVMPSLPGWRVLGNPITPHSFHRLIIQKTCPSREDMYVLGGETAIREALTIYDSVIPVADGEGSEETTCAVHIGYLAGQNLGHMHWHVCDARDPGERDQVEKKISQSLDPERVIFREHGFIAYAEGYRAGQLYLVPESACSVADAAADLASAISDVIALYAAKFKSAQGLPPEYVLAVVCEGIRVRYAVYVPILHHWGFPQYLALSGDSDLVLPWNHETTVEHLKS